MLGRGECWDGESAGMGRVLGRGECWDGENAGTGELSTVMPSADVNEIQLSLQTKKI